ncbi:hypothetical protein [Arthrobacter sulfonylureivorans]|uniref:Uncharacterized protein n=1 Tax=Arthrobacter sulfonylureivorans TaxID=2486855 RepID=A0ABY3WBV8_9MICC|nr:hypothetical protein [Arthrobacter sulfonylureivorans]UNK46685.1 hypothetical protein MNQ99_04825 [Arthrobacter sulfonylureivorans]
MGARPRYIVTTIRVAAGSFLTATAVATVVVMGSAPASAASASLSSVQPPARAVGAVGAAPLLPRDTEVLERQPGQGVTDNPSGANGPGGERISAGGAAAEASKLLGVESVARLEGIRQEMEQAVQLNLVTADQADRFVNQMQERILRGL